MLPLGQPLLYKQVLSARRPHGKEGKPTSSGPESGELAREAASQAPGPVLLTFSHPTPPRSCLHFRPEAVGSAKRLELALLERCRTPTPLLPHHPFKSHQGRVCSKGFSQCPPPSLAEGHHPCEYTPVQGDLSQSLHASVSLHAQQPNTALGGNPKRHCGPFLLPRTKCQRQTSLESISSPPSQASTSQSFCPPQHRVRSQQPAL